MSSTFMSNEEEMATHIMERTLWLKKPLSDRITIAKNIARRSATHHTLRSDLHIMRRIFSNLLFGIYSPEDYTQFMRPA